MNLFESFAFVITITLVSGFCGSLVIDALRWWSGLP